MGTIPKPETRRDLKLIADYLKFNKDSNGNISWKYTISELGLKYAREEGNRKIPLTSTRIHQILNKHGVSKNRIPVR
jgi:hypothetical protein